MTCYNQSKDMAVFTTRVKRGLQRDVKSDAKLPKYFRPKDGIPNAYRKICRKIKDERIVGCYMTKSERWEQHKESEKDVVAGWPAERISQLNKRTLVSVTRICAILGVNRRTFFRLAKGDWTPSASLCRRMSLLEQMADDGTLAADIVPKKAEARRRLMLFRAWWYDQAPKKQLPEVTFHLKVAWGKGKLNYVELPVTFLPRLKILKWEGLVDVVRAIVRTARDIGHKNGQLLWRTIDDEYWKRYATNTLPQIVEERAKLPVKAIRKRWDRARKSSAEKVPQG